MKKDDVLTVSINKEQKKLFLKLAKSEDTTGSREIRRFIAEYIASREKKT